MALFFSSLLGHENSIAKQLEREEQARIREEMREEARALREMEETGNAAQREADKLSQLLEKERREAQASELDEVHKQRMAELERLLQEAEANKERAISRAQMTRSGHAYVISNMGSFGKGVFKVGMTKRLDPMDRAREPRDASAPLPFDIHAKIVTKDAPRLESLIHNEINSHCLNRINAKREFFAISHEELKPAIDRAVEKVIYDTKSSGRVVQKRNNKGRASGSGDDAATESPRSLLKNLPTPAKMGQPHITGCEDNRSARPVATLAC
jgi:hypothetical protein